MSADASPTRVLIVEDDATLAELLARALRAHGTDVEVVTTAEAAEARLADGPAPTLVLLDLNLPGESGWSLFRRGVLGVEGAPPVVVTSAVPVSPSRLREFHVSGYLPKPVSIQVLTECIARLAHGAADESAEEESAQVRKIDA